MAELTVSEGLTTLKMLKARHAELVALRDKNAEKETRFYGASADRTKEIEPVYDVRELDRLVSSVAKELRLLETAIKRSNVRTVLSDYDWSDDKMGELK